MPSVADPVAVARRLADEALVPHAEQVDVEGVRRETLELLAREGLAGLVLTHPQPVFREVMEVLAGADGATWFVSAQHVVPLITCAKAEHPVTPQLADGSLLAGIAIAHVRRPGPPAVTATRVDGGWRYDGTVAWMTGWGLVDVFLLGGLSADGELVLSLLPAREQPGLVASEPMRLAAMQATSTVQLALDGLVATGDAVVDVTDAAAWLAADAAKTANVVPAVFGVLWRVLDLLAPRAPALADRLATEGERLRAAAYWLMDEVKSSEQVEERLALRAQALELVVRAATALVVASGGAGMASSHPAQRLLREAVFHTVQAQTGPVRAATLQHLLDRS